MPQTIAPHLIQPADALLRLAMSVARVVGAGLAGAAVAGFGAGWAIAFDAVTLRGRIGVLRGG
ncbi:MAG TPA: hypothetical protein VE198_14595 [Actinoallomurus sp.]|nr:hypothetical protein [Actinoallomurus sp.]